MKRIVTATLVLLLLGMAAASGCLGGGGGGTSTTSASPTTTPETTSSYTSSTPTSSETTTTTSSSSVPTTTTSTTSSTTSTSTTTTTSIPEAYWHAWEYAPPFELNGETYLITYYKYDYKIQPNQSAPIYEYIVEKSVRKDKIHVYGQDMQGNKVDLGEQEVYAYETIVTPVKAASMDDTLKITMWFASNKSQVFLYPWDAMWMAYLSPTVQDKTFVGVKFEYKGKSALFTNPAPFQSGLFPYFEGGDQDAFNDVNEDLGYLYMGWLATLNFGIWYAWEDVNLLVPQSGGVWSDMQGGHSWEWSTKPDGSATYGGHSFKLVDFSWKYKGTAEQVSMNGKGRLSPYLPPLLVQGEGHYSFKDSQTGRETVIYAYLELKDLKLEKVSG